MVINSKTKNEKTRVRATRINTDMCFRLRPGRRNLLKGGYGLVGFGGDRSRIKHGDGKEAAAAARKEERDGELCYRNQIEPD